MRTLEFTTQIPATQQALYQFHTNFSNVAIVTPRFIKTRFVLVPEEMEEGSRMTVEVDQIFRWMPWDVTVEKLVPHRLMVDVQNGRGPFTVWRHEHHFFERDGKVFLMDRIQYSLPFGFVGKLLDMLFFRHLQLFLFSYRHHKTREYFLRP